MSHESTVVDVDRTPERMPSNPAAADARFWRRYSPYHELPLSSATSLGLHVFVLALLVVAGLLVAAGKGSRGQSDDFPVAVYSSDDEATTPATAAGPAGVLAPKPGDEPPVTPNPPIAKSPLPGPEQLEEPKALPPDIPELKLNAPHRTILDVQTAINTLGKVGETTGPFASRVATEPRNPTKASPNGPSSRPPNDLRVDRVNPRWLVNFTVVDARDHIKQFAGLGAILAMPDGQGQYHVFRDLERMPTAGKVEDVSKIDRIWFIDQKAETVAEIARLLGIKDKPKLLVAFFPQKLEDEMKALENAYRDKKKEAPDRILFRVIPRGGRYTVVVADP